MCCLGGGSSRAVPSTQSITPVLLGTGLKACGGKALGHQLDHHQGDDNQTRDDRGAEHKVVVELEQSQKATQDHALRTYAGGQRSSPVS
jgi:hypothetical protein